MWYISEFVFCTVLLLAKTRLLGFVPEMMMLEQLETQIRLGENQKSCFQSMLYHLQTTVEYAERQCKATENLVNVTEKEFKEMQDQNEKALEEIRANLTNLNDEIPELNDLVCDRSGEPCDAICGGAGCGHCGNSLSCENGAKQQAESALSIANDTENVLREKESTANDFVRNVTQLNTTLAKNLAEKAHQKTSEALAASNNSLSAVKNIKEQIREYLNQNNSTPEDIRAVAQEV